MRRSVRLNVVRINASNANGGHNNSELLLPQDEPAIETQTIGQGDIHVEQQDYDDLNVSGEDGEVQKRGATLLPHVWDLPAGERIVVKCNMLGQPIGREGGVLGQFLGTVARNGGYCPLDKKDWRLVKRNGGDETILDFVKRQADPQKKQPHRAEVYLATHKHKGEQRNEHVDKLEEMMEEQPDLGQNDQGKVVWEGDALHTVLGQEKPEQVHGMGLLPIPKQAYGKKLHLFKDINTTTVEGPLEIIVLEEMGKLKERIEKQDQIIEDLRNKQSSHVNREPEEVNCEATYVDNFQLRLVQSKRKRIECDVTVQDSMSEQQEITKNKVQEQVTQNKIPCRASSKKARPAAMTIGTICVLKSAKYPNKEPVAYATLLTCDPDAEVDGVKLGNQFWKLHITFPIKQSEVLVRPWHHYKTIGDAKGKTVAWPSTFVEKVNG